VRGHHVAIAGAVGAALVVALTLALSSTAGSQSPQTARAADTPMVESSVECRGSFAEFGASVSCTASGPSDAMIDWGDGTLTTLGVGFDGSHLFAALGETTVAVVDVAGSTLASTTVDITPDFEVECELGSELPVYATTAALEGSAEPWDYVYVDDESGDHLYPGDVGYPDGVLAASRMEKVVVGESARVRACRATSAAADAFGGTITWTVSNEWYDDVVTKTRYLTPGTRGTFEGVQPIDVRVDLDLDGYEASERIGLYFGGCG